jgi:MtrB/PioB family decaheme-associated outer membrane protein
MNTSSFKRISTLAVAAALFVPCSAVSQVDTSYWKCKLCPFEEGYRADYEAGATYVSDDSARFGDATGYDEKGGYLNLDGEGSYAADGTQMRWYAEDLGLESRALSIAGGRQGSYDLQLGYSELPYRLYDTTSTVFAASAPDLLSLPAGWVRAPLTSGFTALDNALYEQDIGSDRSILEFGARYLPTSNFDLFAEFRRQERDGVDIASGSGYTQASFLARPLDYHTDEIDLGARYASGRTNLVLAYYGSFFRDNIDSLTWDNPFVSLAGAEQGRMAREPDNDFQQLSLSGSYRAATADTLIAFTAALGRGEQNDGFLPYTINPNIATPALPATSLDGRVDTANYGLTVTSRPFAKTRVKLAYRYDDRDNRTPVLQFSPVIVDSFASGEIQGNVPYSFSRARISASAEYKPLDVLALSAGFERTELDRDYQEVAEQTEDTGWGRVRWRPNQVLDITARAGAAKRDIDSYNTAIAVSYGQNPLMRKYNLAYRYREFGELVVSATPTGSPLSLAVSFLLTDDAYSKSELGLTDSRESGLSADLGWALSDRSSLYLTGGAESIEASQLGSEFGGSADWIATHDDQFNYWGGGFRIAAIADKVDLSVDYTRTDSNTAIDVNGAASGVSQLPDLEATIDSLRMTVAYRQSERIGIDFVLRYERMTSTDWALDGVQPDTLPTILTMGADAYNYKVWAAGLSFSYRIGASTISFPE